jgi:predicted RNase H-like nuclease
MMDRKPAKNPSTPILPSAGSAIGVDGCKAGWFSVAIDSYGDPGFGIFKTIQALWDACHDAGTILIDIPIGLISGAGAGRLCDAAARKALRPRRHGSVFSPPCREALAAHSHAEACAINLRVCGRKISIQAWGISAKIKEVDEFLHGCPQARGVMRETHPEICFRALAGGTPMRHGKKSAAGEAERLELLARAYPRSADIFRAALDRYPRKGLARDDILDALVNAVTALRLKHGAVTLPDHPPMDRSGFPMEIVYAPVPVPSLL